MANTYPAASTQGLGRKRAFSVRTRESRPEALPLSHAIGLTFLELQTPQLKVSFFQLPRDVRVGAEFRAMIQAWAAFFRNLADSGAADLHIRANEAAAGWLDLEFLLHQPDPPPLRPGEYESTDLEEAAELLNRLGGVFQLRVDYPEISALIHVPIS